MSDNFLASALSGDSEGEGGAGRGQTDRDFRRTNVFFVAFLTLGLTFVLAHKLSNSEVFISTALMWVMSCLASGAVVGFLFGIPKIYQGNRTVVESGADVRAAGGTTPAPPQAKAEGVAPEYRQEVNTNLTEISDWLTKIIVGLGLINLGRIPEYLDRMATSLSGGLNPAAVQTEKGFAFGLITCFSIFGFLFGYIYTRVFLSVMFSRSDQQALSKVSQQAQQATEDAKLARKAAAGLAKLTERVELIAAEARAAADNTQALYLGTGGKPAKQPAQAETVSPGPTPGDPWKNQFGRKSESGNRRLDAEVKSATTSRDLFSVRLFVKSTKPEEDPLRGTVQFFLHPTFKNDRPTVTVGPGGVAELVLTAWGAFTVGALADDGRTRLELDLAELPGAPEDFRNR